MVGWKETPEAARALSAGMPILVNSRRVILARVEDGDFAQSGALDDLARQLAWQGIAAETQMIGADGRSIAQLLHAAAEAAHADLLVVGAYGHGRIRELVFGGVTQSFLEGARLPVFMAHSLRGVLGYLSPDGFVRAAVAVCLRGRCGSGSLVDSIRPRSGGNVRGVRGAQGTGMP
jgi:nucleotide-binding universal stress UspA family protein